MQLEWFEVSIVTQRRDTEHIDEVRNLNRNIGGSAAGLDLQLQSRTKESVED